jgi:hypothetical protein
VLVVSAIVLQMGNQLCGINAVFYYSTTFFEGLISDPLVGIEYVYIYICMCLYGCVDAYINTHLSVYLFIFVFICFYIYTYLVNIIISP